MDGDGLEDILLGVAYSYGFLPINDENDVNDICAKQGLWYIQLKKSFSYAKLFRIVFMMSRIILELQNKKTLLLYVNFSYKWCDPGYVVKLRPDPRYVKKCVR